MTGRGNVIQCRLCGTRNEARDNCRLCYAGLGGVSDIGPDVRTLLADTYEEYAQNALRQGDRLAHGIWMQASEIARGFIPTSSTA